MKPCSIILLSTSLLLGLGGCAGNQYGFPLRSFNNDSPNVGELVAFQEDFAHKSAASRSEECRRLSQRQLETPRAGWLLRLMIGRALSDACGDPSKLINAYDNLGRQATLDQPVAGMAAYHSEVLKRMSSLARKATVVERKQKGEAAPKSDKDESKLLREKLEAIRSIEKKMDENSSDEKVR